MLQRDGYYIMSVACILLGVSLFVSFILPTIKRLQCMYIFCLGMSVC